MDARLVWDTWRRILTNDQLVEWVLHSKVSGTPAPAGFTAGEVAILADYAGTPVASDTNIGMYRRGLVRNALASLGYVPLTRHLLYMSELDVEAVAEGFAESNGYADDGPNFWRIAGGFVAYLATLPEFAARLPQDVLALDAAAVALARRLGKSPVEVWPDRAAVIFSEFGSRLGNVSARFVASRAATVVSSSYDLTTWLENPEEFDPDDHLEPSVRYWLIYFPAADAAHGYAELSERTARAFNLLSTPRTAAELSQALDGISGDEAIEVMGSLAELGVIVSEEDRPGLRVKAAPLPQATGDPDHGGGRHTAPREAGGAAIP